jgi:hypothetical protein
MEATYSFAPTLLRPVIFDSFSHLTGAQLGIPNGGSAAAVDISRQYDKRGRILNESDGGITLTEPGTSGTGTFYVYGYDGYQLVCTTITNQYTTYTTCNTVPNTGTLTLSIGSYTAYVSYGSGTTDAAIAASLASQFAASSSPVTVSYTAGSSTLSVTAKTSGTASDLPISISNGGGYTIYDPNSTLTGGVAASTYSALQPANGVIYSYTVPQAGGYAANGNILTHTDSVMGTWSFNYDVVDRLATAASGLNAPSGFQSQNAAWSYDSFGNRTAQTFSGNNTYSNWATYPNPNNRIATAKSAVSGYVYDASGNTLYDGNNKYWYDAEGQLCAVQGLAVTGLPITQLTSLAMGKREDQQMQEHFWIAHTELA